jgi:hypothetical protein
MILGFNSLKRMRLLLPLLCLTFIVSCAGSRPPVSGTPRPNESPYPILYPGSPERADDVRATWVNYAHEQGVPNPPEPELQPVTATVKSIPPSGKGVLRLPRVGTGAQLTEEETRESLRRFLNTAKLLVGAETIQLTLIDSAPVSAPVQTASFEQRPFRYPLRNGYGIVHIGFTQDRRLTDLSSTCIPSADAIQRGFTNLKAVVTPEEAVKIVAGKSVTYSDAGGSHQITVNAGDPVETKQLVVYPMLGSTGSNNLYLHLAWEVAIGSQPGRSIYVDAINSEILGAS